MQREPKRDAIGGFTQWRVAVPPIKRGDWNPPRVYLDPFDEGVLHLSNFAPGQPCGRVDRNDKFPELPI